MKLGTVGPIGEEIAVVFLDADTYVDVSDVISAYDAEFFASAAIARLPGLVHKRSAHGHAVQLNDSRVGAPIARPHQILCIGLNFSDHAKETGQTIPDEPIVFNKAPNTLVGPHDPVRIPRGSTKTDWEVELGVVIGRRCRYLRDLDEAREAIVGYVLVNDVSEREFQLERGGQWVKGKSAETFNPCGPWLVTPDELGDIGDLEMWLSVNGERRQSGTTANMIFDPAFVVHYLSQFMVLEPGDLINTGTPPGVGLGHLPPIYLKAGDEMELGIDGLGTQRQHVVPAP